MAWKFSDSKPIYIQVADILTMDIIRGAYSLGQRFPSVRDLASAANINPNTMQRALSELEEKNILVSQGTNGRLVTDDEGLIQKLKNDIINDKFFSFYKEVRGMGLSKTDIINYINSLEE